MEQRPQETCLTVDQYLETLNSRLQAESGRIVGEVTQLQLYPGRTYLFFSLKDKEANATISCMMWKRTYDICGIALEEGMEIIVSGNAEIYKPSGRLTFQARTVEHVGEGALKKAYEKLKAQLSLEGLFEESKKRPIPSFVCKIGIVTSRSGAVINDFLSNIARRGFQISLVDSRVEGQLATAELLASIRTFRSKDIDVLVVIRGGGSLESLQPFNNELLVREIATFPVPVIAGIGHDKDITLAAMAADIMVSTPTAVTALLNDSWSRAEGHVSLWESQIFSGFRQALTQRRSTVALQTADIKDHFQHILDRFSELAYGLRSGLGAIRQTLDGVAGTIAEHRAAMLRSLSSALRGSQLAITAMERELAVNDPERLLRLGYSIIKKDGRVIKSVRGTKKGEAVTIRMTDGTIESSVTAITSS